MTTASPSKKPFNTAAAARSRTTVRFEAKLAQLKERYQEINDLSAAGAVLGWDQATYMPRGGATARGRDASRRTGELALWRRAPLFQGLGTRSIGCSPNLATSGAGIRMIRRGSAEEESGDA